MDFTVYITLLPIVFMMHDFEELIFLKPWLGRNREMLYQRFPALARKILPHLDRLSTNAFALAVAEEFVLLSVITYTAVLFEYYYVWFAALAAFTVHLLVHIGQWLVLRRYIPAIVTSLLSLPYCLYTLYLFCRESRIGPAEGLLWSAGGLILMVLNLLLAHRLGTRLDAWLSVTAAPRPVPARKSNQSLR